MGKLEQAELRCYRKNCWFSSFIVMEVQIFFEVNFFFKIWKGSNIVIILNTLVSFENLKKKCYLKKNSGQNVPTFMKIMRIILTAWSQRRIVCLINIILVCISSKRWIGDELLKKYFWCEQNGLNLTNNIFLSNNYSKFVFFIFS